MGDTEVEAMVEVTAEATTTIEPDFCRFRSSWAGPR